MLDIKKLLEKYDQYDLRFKTRDPGIDITPLKNLDLDRKRLIRETESLKARRNEASKIIGARKKTGEDASDLLEEMKSIGEKIDSSETGLADIENKLTEFLHILPNIPIDPTPPVPDKSGNKTVFSWGKAVSPENWPFPFKNHLEVGNSLAPSGGLDFTRAAKMTGSNWPLYRGELAWLEWALVWYLINKAVEFGHELIIPPYLVNSDSMFSSGQFPKFHEQAYECKNDDLVLIPTSEVPLLNLFRKEILDENDLPVRLASFTPCFRREAGTYGKEERGLIRIHQFHKTEIFAFTKPDESGAELNRMIEYAQSLLIELELPFRTTLLAAGDLAHQAACTYDIEAWLPGQNKFSEVSSISNCTDFQARRASIRFRPAGSKKPEFVHSLNGSALATSRLMVAILENYQRPDGGLEIPGILRKYLGGKEHIPPKPA